MWRKQQIHLKVICLLLYVVQMVPDPCPSQCQQEISISVPEGGDMQHPLNILERFAMLYWSPALAGTWMKIAVIHSGKSNPYNSSFTRHISVSKGRFIVTNASKAIAGNLKIVHEIDERECLASIRLNVAEPAPTSAPASLARDDRLNRTTAREPGSQSSYIVAVVVGTVVALLVLVLALGLWQRNNIARHIRWFRSHLGFPARATPSQQAGDAGPMQELMQPEDASSGDRSAVPNGELLSSAEMLNAGGLESMELPPPHPSTSGQCAAAVKKANRALGLIKKGTENKTENIMLPVHKALAPPRHEYGRPISKKMPCNWKR